MLLLLLRGVLSFSTSSSSSSSFYLNLYPDLMLASSQVFAFFASSSGLVINFLNILLFQSLWFFMRGGMRTHKHTNTEKLGIWRSTECAFSRGILRDNTRFSSYLLPIETKNGYSNSIDLRFGMLKWRCNQSFGNELCCSFFSIPLLYHSYRLSFSAYSSQLRSNHEATIVCGYYEYARRMKMCRNCCCCLY